MRIPYRADPALYNDYFKNQVGHGMPVYIGRGGLGNVLSGLFRSVVPLIKRGGRALLKEGVRTAVQVGSDVIDGKNIKTALKSRTAETGKRMLRDTIKNSKRPIPHHRVDKDHPENDHVTYKSPIKRGRKNQRSQHPPDPFTKTSQRS